MDMEKIKPKKNRIFLKTILLAIFILILSIFGAFIFMYPRWSPFVFILFFMIGIGIDIFLFILLTAKLFIRYKIEKSLKNKLMAILSVSIIITGFGFEIYLWERYTFISRDSFEYEINLESSSDNPELVYIPISNLNELSKSLKVQSGSGKFKTVTTDYGKALEINFTSKISIKCKIFINKYFPKDEIFSYNLTMLNQTKNTYMNNREYWIFYKPSNTLNYNCSLEISLDHWHTNNISDSIYINIYLKIGWNKYWGYLREYIYM